MEFNYMPVVLLCIFADMCKKFPISRLRISIRGGTTDSVKGLIQKIFVYPVSFLKELIILTQICLKTSSMA